MPSPKPSSLPTLFMYTHRRFFGISLAILRIKVCLLFTFYTLPIAHQTLSRQPPEHATAGGFIHTPSFLAHANLSTHLPFACALAGIGYCPTDEARWPNRKSSWAVSFSCAASHYHGVFSTSDLRIILLHPSRSSSASSLASSLSLRSALPPIPSRSTSPRLNRQSGKLVDPYHHVAV